MWIESPFQIWTLSYHSTDVHMFLYSTVTCTIVRFPKSVQFCWLGHKYTFIYIYKRVSRIFVLIVIILRYEKYSGPIVRELAKEFSVHNDLLGHLLEQQIPWNDKLTTNSFIIPIWILVISIFNCSTRYGHERKEEIFVSWAWHSFGSSCIFYSQIILAHSLEVISSFGKLIIKSIDTSALVSSGTVFIFGQSTISAAFSLAV